jgi:hypothetical protein
MRLLRVEVYVDGELIEGRTFPNLVAARIHADHQQAQGRFAIVMYPRAEPRHDSDFPLGYVPPPIKEMRNETEQN